MVGCLDKEELPPQAENPPGNESHTCPVIFPQTRAWMPVVKPRGEYLQLSQEMQTQLHAILQSQR